jgi:hypothetical protein
MTLDCAAAETRSKEVAYQGVVQPLVARFSGSCVVPAAEVGTMISQTALGSALAGIFIPKLAGVAVDLVGQLLQKAGEDKKSIMQASAGPYLYRVNPWTDKGRSVDQLPNARCLHLLSFRESVAGTTDWASIVEGTGRDAAAVRSVQESLGMTGLPAPTFYMEFAVVISGDQTSFMLVPTFLKYGRGFGGRKSNTELVAAISVSHPEAEKPFASTTVLLRDLEVGKVYDAATLLGSWSDWMPLDKPSEAVSEAKGKPKPDGTIERQRLFDPLNVRTALTETQDGIKLLKTIGEAISSSKDDVAKAVGASLPTEEKEKTDQTTRLDDRNAYLTAMEEVKIKEKELAAETDGVKKATAAAALVKAKLAANKAALKAGINLPYGELYSELD